MKMNLMIRLAIVPILLLWTGSALAQNPTQLFDFHFEEATLNGVIMMPKDTEPRGMVIMVPGAGRTNAVAQRYFLDIRTQLAQDGYATFIYDKQGCGNSTGTFDGNQPVDNSALEVISAINSLKEAQVQGADNIGLWGISRAGWIIPLVINQRDDIAFWVSVSGVDAQENFGYLLEENLRILGYPADSINLLVSEWAEGNRICHEGGSYEECLAATQNFRANAFVRRFNGGEGSEEAYYQYQQFFSQQTMDQETGLQVYIPAFEHVLAEVDCPVLALFGEEDKNVDWQKTKALYEQTLGPNTDLTIRSFAGCNHNMFEAETGGFFEFQDSDLPYVRCRGMLEAMSAWLSWKAPGK